MNLDLLYTITSTINATTSLSLGLFILLQNPNSKLHQLWGWLSLMIALWAGGLAVSFSQPPGNYSLALFSVRFSNTAAIFIPLLYYHFIASFLGKLDQKTTLRFFYALGALIACFGFTPYFITSVSSKAGITHYLNAGLVYPLLIVLYFVVPIRAIYLTWQERRIASGRQRAQITSVMAAGILGFFLGATFFPLTLFRDSPSPIGGHLVWLYCLSIAWAVFKHHLFDIHLIIRKSLIYFALITLLTTGYFGFVYIAERIFQTTFGYQSMWISLTAFALMSLLFQPLKAGVQQITDWLFFKAPQEELARRMEYLEDQVKASEKFKAVSTLAAGMAHEIKNPLTALRTFADYLPEKHKDPKFARTFQGVLLAETGRIQNIVQDLLDFAKPKPPNPKKIDLTSLLNSTIDLLSNELLKKNIKWVVSCRHNSSLVWVDPDQLRQVLINLIQNAADAIPGGGILALKTQVINNRLELSISDTGDGISKETLARVFDPFVTTKRNGTGLGLAMSYSILRANEGSIRVESKIDQGTTFTVSFPI